MILRQLLCALGFHSWRDTLIEGQWDSYIRRDCACCPSSHVVMAE